MIRTLDRYILRSYLQSFLLCLLVMLSVRIVGDLSANMDEFAELLTTPNPDTGANFTFWDMVCWIFSYYGNQLFVYVAELGGTIIVAAAAFTVARMNYTNELTAMLASGVSLHRVVVPILLAAVAFSALVAVDQEYVIPNVRDKLILDPDAFGVREGVNVRLIPDERSTVWYATLYDPNTRTASNPLWILRDADNYAYQAHIVSTKAIEGTFGKEHGWWTTEDGVIGCRRAKGGEPWHTMQGAKEIYTTQGPRIFHDMAYREYRKTHPEFTLAPGAYITNATSVAAYDPLFDMSIAAEKFLAITTAQKKVTGWKLIKPRFQFHGSDKTVLATVAADEAVWVPGNSLKQHWALKGGRIFYATKLRGLDLELFESGSQLEYSSNSELTQLLESQATRNPKSVQAAKYVRFVNPINNIIMLMLGLPFILSRQRNIKASALLCVLIVAAFFGFIYVCRYIDLPPIWAACLPTLLFGPISVLMLDAIKT